MNDGFPTCTRRPPKGRRKRATWPRVAQLSLNITFAVSVCLLVWLSERTAAVLATACVCLASWLALSWLRK